jgi:hypothetical protein
MANTRVLVQSPIYSCPVDAKNVKQEVLHRTAKQRKVRCPVLRCYRNVMVFMKKRGLHGVLCKRKYRVDWLPSQSFDLAALRTRTAAASWRTAGRVMMRTNENNNSNSNPNPKH